ncbi:MAG: hypothetical protein ACREP7_05485 [Lysobacter sp.]
MNRWIRMILARKEPTEREKKLRTLACQFVDECHAYDLRVCSEHGFYGPIPYSTREAMLCSRHALHVRKRLFGGESFTNREIADAVAVAKRDRLQREAANRLKGDKD